MSAGEATSDKFSRLRQQAEALVAAHAPDWGDASSEELQRLIHELSVYQVELELQNEELRATQLERERVQKNYVALYDSAPVGYITLNEDGVVVEANLTSAALLGVNRSSLVGARLSRFVAPEDQDAYHLYWWRLFNIKTLQRSDLRLVKKNGSPFYARLEGQVVQADSPEESRSNHASLQQARIVVSDINREWQAEARLRQSEARLEGIISTATDAIITIDARQRIILFNATAAQIFGYQANQVIGRPLDLLLPERFQDAHAQYVDDFGQAGVTARRMGIMPDGLCGRRADGSEFPIEAMISQVEVSGQKFYTVILRDITERKRAEAEIERSHRWLVRIAQTTPDIIFVLDIVNKRNVYTNHSILEMLGYAPDEFERLPDILQKVITPEDLLQTEAFYHEMADAKPGEVRLLTHRTLHKDGSMRWIENRVAPFTWDENGRLSEVIGLARDITERKRAEANLEQLFQEVSEQREQLRALTRQLAEAQEVERKALARELHDRVGQKLTALNLNLNLIRAQLAKMAAETGPIQARLDDSLGLLAEMTEHIRDVMTNLRPPMLDDYGLLTTLRWYGSQLASRVAFTLTVQGKEPVPRLAPQVENALFRIAQEALTNVAKHAQASQVMITVSSDDKRLRLIIVDDGLGFELARQAGEVERQGWGLITMRERAQAVGGQCHITSRPGQGTQVIVEVNRPASAEN